MSSVYRVEASIDNVTVVTPPLSAVEFGVRPSLFISAFDGSNVWAIEARLAYHAYSSGPVLYELRAEFYFYFAVTFDGDPASGSFVSGTFSQLDADGNNGAPITAGFTIAIEKDEALDELRFITPLGTVTHSLTSFGALDATPLRMDAMAHQFIRPNTSADGQDNFGWFDFYGKQDGTPFQGTALSATDPGAWSGITDVTFGSPSGAIANSSNTQDPTRYNTSMSYAGADGVRAGGSRQWRVWVGGDSLMASGDSGLAFAHAAAHGPIFAAYSQNDSLDTLRWRRTYDNGGNWEEGVIYTGGTSNRSPSLSWQDGRLYAVWYDGTQILQSISLDLATNWSTPVTLSISGSNPRLLVDPRSGLSFYFYIDSTDLKLLRSDNFGVSFIDGAPISVATGIGAQTVAAEFASDGSLVVGFIVSNTWTQVRSKDMGLTWG